MSLLTIQQSFNSELISALCRTLAHSLWQGLLLAIIAAIVMIASKRSGPVLRYNLLTVVALLFVAGAVITFLVQLNDLPGTAHLANAIVIDRSGKNILPATPIHAQGGATISSTIIAFIDQYANGIALAWFLILLFKAIRLATGLYSIHKIKRAQITDAGEYWNERIGELAKKLRVSKPVRLFQSGIATVPVVLGYFKPVILFPIGLLASLPATEVEAVLLHELAHVRRKDYLVNLLQQLIEVFFFFNPAVLWVSSLIRTERENCCDDIALAQTSQNKINYINALIAFQQYCLALPQYAPALTGRKDQLLGRVKRIIYNNNKTLNAMEKIFLTAGIAVAGFLALAFYPARNTDRPETTASILQAKSLTAKITPIPPTRMDTIPLFINKSGTGLSNINTIVDGKRYDLQLKESVVMALSIDGQKIADDKIADHKTITDVIIKQAKENMAREKLLSEKALLAAQDAGTAAETSKMLGEKMQQASELSKIDEERSLQLLQKLKEDNVELSKIKEDQSLKLLMELKEQLKTNEAKSLQETEMLLNKLKLQGSLSDARLSKELSGKLQTLSLADEKNQLHLAELEKDLSQKDVLRGRLDAEKSLKLSQELRTSAALSMKKDQLLQLNAHTTSGEIIDDLIHEKLIKNKKDINFSLNKDALIVNGVKQPNGIFQKFKEKYVKTKDWNFNYNNKE